MSLSLYTATIPTFQQITHSTAALLDQAAAFCEQQQLAHEEIIEARLIDDMLPFSYQIKSVVVHSVGAIEGVRKGVFSPDTTEPPKTLAALKQKIDDASKALAALEPSELDSFVGRDMRFEMGDFRLDFTAENFLLSFSQPNFFFHATTAYDILRMKGAAIGKIDYMGPMRTKR